MDTAVPVRPARRRRSPGWLPNQHGAWAMLVLPLAVGALRAGPRWAHLWLFAAGLIGYLAFFATGLYLRSGLKPRYRPPVLAFATAAVVGGGGLLAWQPELLRWGVVYLPLLVASLWFSARRAERAIVNDLITIAAASLIAVVAFWMHDDGAWLPGSGSGAAWTVAGVVFGYLVGTALYVKTMIRERGEAAWYAASVAYHVAIAVVISLLLTPAGPVFAALAIRAAAVPRLFPRARPVAIGLCELAASVVLAVVLLASPLE